MHNFLHWLFGVDDIVGEDGEILYRLVVMALVEKDATHVVEQHMAAEKALLVDHREDIALRRRHQGQQVAEQAIRVDGAEISFYQLVDSHHVENTLILVVRHFHTLLGNGIGINRMLEKQPIDGIGQGRYNHQRDDERIAVSDFGDEEDARQWRVEHARHEAAHPDEGELGRV